MKRVFVKYGKSSRRATSQLAALPAPLLWEPLLDNRTSQVYNKTNTDFVDERNEYIRLWQFQRADGSGSSARTGG